MPVQHFLFCAEDSDSDVATSFTNYHEHAVDVSASVGPLGHTFRVSDDVHPMKCPGPATSDSITPSLKDGPGRPESPSDGYMTQVRRLARFCNPLLSAIDIETTQDLSATHAQLYHPCPRNSWPSRAGCQLCHPFCHSKPWISFGLSKSPQQLSPDHQQSHRRHKIRRYCYHVHAVGFYPDAGARGFSTSAWQPPVACIGAGVPQHVQASGMTATCSNYYLQVSFAMHKVQ